MLGPGRGLRETKLSYINTMNPNHKEQMHLQNNFAVAARVNICDNLSVSDIDHIEHQIGTAYSLSDDKRIIKIDGKIINNHVGLLDILSIFWLTPQMDQVLVENAASRRKFFDKITANFFPHFGDHLHAYERLLKERSKILKMPNIDLIWLSSVEEDITIHAVSIIELRTQMIKLLNEASEHNNSKFPRFFLSFATDLERQFSILPGVKFEEEIRHNMFLNREKDMLSGRTNFGPHRADIDIYFLNPHSSTHQHINISSTGEQKALLCSITLSAVYHYIKTYRKTPIILLDEIASHFDEQKLAQLFDYLDDFQIQYFITGTDEKIFKKLIPNAQYIRLVD